MNIVDNHPAAQPNYPATDAMAAEDAARIPTLCPVAVASLARTQEILFEKTVLEEFLNEDTSMSETIDNLTQLLNHDNISTIVSKQTLFNLRRALVSLEGLFITMGLKS